MSSFDAESNQVADEESSGRIARYIMIECNDSLTCRRKKAI